MNDPTRTPSAAEIISALGTVALAERLGHNSPSTVGSWKSRNAIPPGNWDDVVAAAVALGRPDITVSVLAAAYPKRSHRSRSAGSSALAQGAAA